MGGGWKRRRMEGGGRGSNARAAPPSNCLFVLGLPPAARDQDLRDVPSHYCLFTLGTMVFRLS